MTADYIIDLGHEGGDAGGRVVATGTPEQVAKVKASYTGQFLAPLLKEQPAPLCKVRKKKEKVGV